MSLTPIRIFETKLDMNNVYLGPAMRGFLTQMLKTYPARMKNKYIVGVEYATKPKFQIGLSGTRKKNETLEQCFLRELQEEAGLFLDSTSSCIFVDNGKKGRLPWLLGLVDIDKLAPSPRTKLNRSKDQKSKGKVGCFIVGDKHSLMRKMRDGYNSTGADYITGHVLYSVELIKEYLAYREKMDKFTNK